MMCTTSNRNTAFLLLLLFVSVLAIILVAHNHDKRKRQNAATTPSSSHVAPPPTPTNTPPPYQAAPPPSGDFNSPPPHPQPPPTPALVPDLVVASDGTGNYTTVADAVDAAPSHSKRRFFIRVKAGVYRENVKVSDDKINLVLFGDGMNETVLTSNRSAIHGWSTSYTATLGVSGDGFMAQDMTIENTAGPEGAQAVALLSESDRSVFYRCNIIGYQDTLYAKHNHQFYRDCHIYGTIDFIFGYATAVFQNCNLYARKPLLDQTITFTAQGRNSTTSKNGFSIHNCTITLAPEWAESSMVDKPFQSFLGRPWKEYSTTVVMQSFLDGIIDPLGWLAWNQSYIETVYYAEYRNIGPGANTNHRVRWPGYRIMNNSTEASMFTVAEFINGDEWLPFMNVPYVGGLI